MSFAKNAGFPIIIRPMWHEIKIQKADTTMGSGILYSTKVVEGKPIKKGLEIAHHNQELYNPFADPLSANLPLLMLMPAIEKDATDKDGSPLPPRIVLMETQKEVIEMRDFLLANGFYFPSHIDYKKEFESFRTPLTDDEFKLIKEGKHQQPEVELTEYKKLPLDDQLKLLITKVRKKDDEMSNESDTISRRLHQKGRLILMEELDEFYTKHENKLSDDSKSTYQKFKANSKEPLSDTKSFLFFKRESRIRN